jgi:hypothetical protein
LLLTRERQATVTILPTLLRSEYRNQLIEQKKKVALSHAKNYFNQTRFGVVFPALNSGEVMILWKFGL